MTNSYKFDDRDIDWALFAGFDDLWYFILDVDDDAGRVDMLMKFAPQARCVPHNHVGATRTLVLEGSHHLWHLNGDEPELEKVRRPGAFSSNDGDEIHIEAGGPEGAIILLMMPVGLWLGGTAGERALLIACSMLILITELLNSAVEAVVDRIGPEWHELSKRAKDLGSAAAFIIMITAAVVWGLIAYERFLG